MQRQPKVSRRNSPRLNVRHGPRPPPPPRRSADSPDGDRPPVPPPRPARPSATRGCAIPRSPTEGSPGESSLHRARCSRMVLAGNVGRGDRSPSSPDESGTVIMARRAYSHQVWGSPTVSLNRGVRGGSWGSWGSIDGEGGGRLRGGQQRLTGGPLLLGTILY
jgi:hypothetical protein